MKRDQDRGAIFDRRRVYRYALWRTWSRSEAPLLCVLLNPSTADGDHDDPTITRCIGVARRNAYGGIIVANLFAFRATSPRALFRASSPVGPRNDAQLRGLLDRGHDILLAWGNHGAWRGRDGDVLRLLKGGRVFCLGRTQRGQPRHPLYLPRTAPLIAWQAYDLARK